MENKNQHNEKNEFDYESNLLNSIPKKNNFKTPENYFNQFEDQLLQKITFQKETTIRKLNPTNKTTTIVIALLSVAASIVFIIKTFVSTTNNEFSNDSSSTIQDYSIDYFENTLEAHLNSIDTLLVAELSDYKSSEIEFTLSDIEDIFNDENFY